MSSADKNDIVKKWEVSKINEVNNESGDDDTAVDTFSV